MERSRLKIYFGLASLTFYLLTFVLFFFVGLAYAGFIDAGKGQGLAAAAIVLGYGFSVGGISLLAAIILVGYLKYSVLVLLNKILAALVLVVFLFVWLRGLGSAEARRSETPIKQAPVKPVSSTAIPLQQQEPMGLGVAIPDVYNQKALYFYNNPTFGKSPREHSPGDSVVFRRTERGVEIAAAPPWFWPLHLKMDYEVLHLRALSIYNDFVEVRVNEQNKRSTFVARSAVKLLYWPEFLLTVNSVDPLNKADNLVRVKPLSHASPVTKEYAILKPLRVSQNWLYVELLDNNYKSLGNGWIRWQKDGLLLLRYSLFS